LFIVVFFWHNYGNRWDAFSQKRAKSTARLTLKQERKAQEQAAAKTASKAHKRRKNIEVTQRLAMS